MIKQLCTEAYLEMRTNHLLYIFIINYLFDTFIETKMLTIGFSLI